MRSLAAGKKKPARLFVLRANHLRRQRFQCSRCLFACTDLLRIRNALPSCSPHLFAISQGFCISVFSSPAPQFFVIHSNRLLISTISAGRSKKKPAVARATIFSTPIQGSSRSSRPFSILFRPLLSSPQRQSRRPALRSPAVSRISPLLCVRAFRRVRLPFCW